MKRIWSFLKEEDGLELSEYAVMAALIVVGTAAIITGLGGAIQGVFGTLTTEITP
jgi:Flp pilus assembly pilin Flp